MRESDSVTTTSLETEQSRDILVPRRCTLAGFAEATSELKGLYVGSLAPVTRLAVTTRNTEYKITVVEPGDWKVLVQGGRFFPTERLAYLCGSGPLEGCVDRRRSLLRAFDRRSARGDVAGSGLSDPHG